MNWRRKVKGENEIAKPLSELALIQWEDSQGCPRGWQFLDDVDDVPVVIRSIGWVLRETNRYVVLAPHVGGTNGDENQGQGIMTIPKRCIVSRTAISYSLTA